MTRFGTFCLWVALLAAIAVAQPVHTSDSGINDTSTVSGHEGVQALPNGLDTLPNAGGAVTQSRDKEHRVDTLPPGTVVDDEAVQERRPPQTGRLVLSSNPPDAAVIVGGERVGVTPVTLEGLASGEHRIELRRKGYYGRAVTVRIVADAEVRANVDLVRPASLSLSSQPDSARVIRDGADAGYTPVVLEPVRPGSVSLRFEKEGYASLDTVVSVADGASDSLRVKLGRTQAWTDSVAALEQGRDESAKRTRGLISLAAFGAFSIMILVLEFTR